uniref:Acyl-CoA dehydrogenase/oxidase C-terminal domain-containing protein n=1 Tax=Ditylenchus dipsaci TaxID=166011 RepID=A0A915EDI9_9BILA
MDALYTRLTRRLRKDVVCVEVSCRCGFQAIQTPCKEKDGSVKDKISAFVVERNFGGVTNGPPEKKMGIKGSNTAEVYFDNVRVPVENLIGEEGEGFKVAMNILNNGRFGLPAGCTGSMKYCIKKTIDHVNSRVQFGKKLREFGNVHEKLADMIVRHYVTESIVYMLASNMDAGVPEFQLEAAIAKVVASENAWHVCDEAIQLHGGMGFMRDCGLERVLRDLRIFRIFEGANDIMRMFVALTGMQHAGKHLQQLSKDIKSGSVTALFGEVRRRAFSDLGGDVSSAVDPSLKESGALLNGVIEKFGTSVQSLLSHHGRGITDRQYELLRVANAAIDIYSMVAVLSRASYAIANNSSGNVLHDQQIAQLFVGQASKRALASLKETDGSNTNETDLIGKIAVAVCDKQAMIQKHPINI